MKNWAPVLGYIGFYSVSSDGELRRDETKTGVPFLIKKQKDKDGYETYRVSKYGDAETVKIHQLVARAFLGCPPKGCVVNHKDGDKANNKVENLEYATRKENIQHAIQTGLLPTGERSTAAKLTTQEIHNIRAAGISQKELAQKYGVSRQHINRIILKQRRKHD